MKRKTRKPRTQLPRLTVMSWSRRELAAFVLAVEQLGHHVQSLAEQIDRMKVRQKLKAASTNGAQPAAEGRDGP
jgi:hypothetical protein